MSRSHSIETYRKAKKTKIIKVTKNKPISSEITESMKSESLIGRNLKYDWVPSPTPFPKKPPDPIATFD